MTRVSDINVCYYAISGVFFIIKDTAYMCGATLNVYIKIKYPLCPVIDGVEFYLRRTQENLFIAMY